MIKVSVITVVRNGARTIGTALASVAAQDHVALEHIIVDGASTDQTLDIIKSHEAKNVRWVSEPDNGIYDAMNKGIGLATGDLIGFLNADDYFCRKNAVRILAEAAINYPDASAVSGGVAIVNESGLLRRYYRAKGFRSWMLRVGHMPPHPAFYARRSAFDEVGRFDDQLKICGDFEWMVRFFRNHKLTAHFIDETITTFRMGGVTNRGLGSRVAVNQEAMLACERHGISTSQILMWSKYAVKLSQYFLQPPDFPLPQSEILA